MEWKVAQEKGRMNGSTGDKWWLKGGMGVPERLKKLVESGG